MIHIKIHDDVTGETEEIVTNHRYILIYPVGTELMGKFEGDGDFIAVAHEADVIRQIAEQYRDENENT